MAESGQKLYRAGRKDLDRAIVGLLEKHLRVQALLEALVIRALLSGRLGELRYRRRQQSEVQRIIHRLGDEVGRPTERLVRAAVRLGMRIALRDLPRSDDDLSGIQAEAIDLLADNLGNRLYDARTTVGRRVDDVFRKEALRLSAESLSGDTDATSDRMARRLSDQGVTAFEDRNGHKWDLDTYANMAMRTTTSEAIFQGTQTAMLARGFDLVEVNRSADACEICKPYEGKTYSLTGRSDEYPKLEITFPIHPLCEHFISPSSKAEAEREAFLGRVG